MAKEIEASIQCLIMFHIHNDECVNMSENKFVCLRVCAFDAK